MSEDKPTTEKTPPAAGGQPASICCDENAIMEALFNAGFDAEAMRVLTAKSWKDGIDIDRPSYPLLRFVAIIQHNTNISGA